MCASNNASAPPALAEEHSAQGEHECSDAVSAFASARRSATTTATHVAARGAWAQIRAFCLAAVAGRCSLCSAGPASGVGVAAASAAAGGAGCASPARSGSPAVDRAVGAAPSRIVIGVVRSFVARFGGAKTPSPQ